MKFPALACFAPLIALTMACDDDNGTEPQAPLAQVRVVNASATNDNVDLFVNGQRVGTQSFAFGAGSTACFDVPAGTRTVEFRTAGSTSALARVSPDPSFAEGSSHTVVVTGAGANARALVVSDEFTPASGDAALRIIHASPALGRRDVFVTAPGLTISGSPTFANVDFGTATQFRNVDPGEIRIRFTNPGSTTVAFDGNGTPPFSLAANQVRTFVVTDIAGGGMPNDGDNLVVLEPCP